MTENAMDNDIMKYVSRLRKVYITKQKMRSGEINQACYSCYATADRYLRIISKMAKTETSLSRSKKKEKLDDLLNLCKTKTVEENLLQGAVMEIPELAPQSDESSVNVLAELLDHNNKYIRKNACKSIGYIGGDYARKILKKVNASRDHEMESEIKEALECCEAGDLKADFESECWTDEAVKTMITMAIQPYKRAIKTMGLVFSLLTLESIIAVVYMIWRAI